MRDVRLLGRGAVPSVGGGFVARMIKMESRSGSRMMIELRLFGEAGRGVSGGGSGGGIESAGMNSGGVNLRFEG